MLVVGVCHLPVGGEQRGGWSSGELFNLLPIYSMRGQRKNLIHEGSYVEMA